MISIIPRLTLQFAEEQRRTEKTFKVLVSILYAIVSLLLLYEKPRSISKHEINAKIIIIMASPSANQILVPAPKDNREIDRLSVMVNGRSHSSCNIFGHQPIKQSNISFLKSKNNREKTQVSCVSLYRVSILKFTHHQAWSYYIQGLIW